MGSAEGVRKSWLTRSRKAKESTRLARSQTMRGRTLTQVHRRHISDTRKRLGLGPSSACIEAVRQAVSGRSLTLEHRRKVGEGVRRYLTDGRRFTKRTRGELAVRGFLIRYNVLFNEQCRPVTAHGGRPVGTVDFWLPKSKLAVEVDGWFHQFPDAVDRDRFKDQAYEANGYRILRLDRYEVLYRWAVAEAKVLEALNGT